MSKAIRFVVSAVVVSVLLFGSLGMAPAARSGATIHLKSGSFIPAQGQFAQGSQKYFIVQFAGPIQEAWKDAVKAEGAEILDYIHDFALKVRMNPAIANRVGHKDFVSAVAA